MSCSGDKGKTLTTHTVIVGSGIIGLCTAYYLSESGHTSAQSIHVIDTSQELFRCASGLAAGFLAQDCTWLSYFGFEQPHLKQLAGNTGKCFLLTL